MTEYRIAFVTTKNVEEAEFIAKELVDRKLAACVNIIPEVISCYQWQGKIEVDREAKMFIKTRSELVNSLVEIVKKLHSYEVCEVTVIPISDGNRDYLRWIDEVTVTASKITS